MTELIAIINDYLWAKLIVIFLVAIGLFFLTVNLGFLQIRFFPEMIRLLWGSGKKIKIQTKKLFHHYKHL
ncbi:hypothetical protein GCM10020331_053360 [Ectobacillus funiculus]